MKVASRIAGIAAGYGLAIAAGVIAVALNETLVPADVSQSSGGMVAFGDMMLFVPVVGVVALAPTWLLLKRLAETAPRALLIALLTLAATGPLSWGAVIVLSGGGGSSFPLGALLAFGAIPRIVAGPVVIVIDFLALFLLRDPAARRLIAAAMLTDIAPMGLFFLHMFRATHS